MDICGDQCSLVASQAVWTNDVCTGALLTKPPESGCHCAAAQAGVPRAVVVACLLIGAALALRRRPRRRG
jgi:hypothetical protein